MAVLAVAILAAALHLLPFLLARSVTPPDWRFTGNAQPHNPDVMQYRVWFRQTQREGPIVTNVFTAEPNRPHIVLVFAYLVGKSAGWLGTEPELVYEYGGAVLAFVFVVVLLGWTRRFFASDHQWWWVSLALLVGGGLGAHLKLFMRFDAVKSNPVIERILFDPLQRWPVFEDYRGHFVFTTLFDTHFLMNWTLAFFCLIAFHRLLKRFTWWGLAITTLLYGAMAVVHLYEGVTLIVVTSAITLLCWRKQVAVRPAFTGLLVTSSVVLAVLLWQVWLAVNAGIRLPSWQALMVLPTILFLAYPLQWVILGGNIGNLWNRADLDIVFLVGWALGCTALTLSGPFYPYPDRGTLTLQIPLTVLAGIAYFQLRPRVGWRAGLIVVLILGATPAWRLGKTVFNAGFRSDAPAAFESRAHRETIDLLASRATPEDLLLADRNPTLWLAPEYPGRHYVAHFFLTVDFERKRAEMEQFFLADAGSQARFLEDTGVRFLFVEATDDPTRFAAVPGLVLLKAIPDGSLFEYRADARR
jgi:hypothetical protein